MCRMSTAKDEVQRRVPLPEMYCKWTHLLLSQTSKGPFEDVGIMSATALQAVLIVSSVAEQNEHMIKLMKQLKERVTDEDKQQIEELLERVCPWEPSE
jgi:hypothetical protein